jgi:hypothetical protein
VPLNRFVSQPSWSPLIAWRPSGRSSPESRLPSPAPWSGHRAKPEQQRRTLLFLVIPARNRKPRRNQHGRSCFRRSAAPYLSPGSTTRLTPTARANRSFLGEDPSRSPASHHDEWPQRRRCAVGLIRSSRHLILWGGEPRQEQEVPNQWTSRSTSPTPRNSGRALLS